MKKMIIILFLMSSFFINVCIVNAETKEELEKKYEFFSKLVEQDIESQFVTVVQNETDIYIVSSATNSQKLGAADNAITTINLNYNGGFGVYPNDITSSNNLTYATTY